MPPEITQQDIALAVMQTEVHLAKLEAKFDAFHTEFIEFRKEMRVFVQKQIEMNSSIKSQIAVLQIKAGAWGAIAGAVMILGALLLRYAGG